MIGIIGGNGVAATNRLAELLEEKFVKDGAYRDAHHPEMIIWQATQAPSRSMYLEGRGPSFIEDYVQVGRKLKECGCTELCMCCNTAHYAVDELSEKIGWPFINIIDEVAKRVAKRSYTSAVVMCSDGCRITNLYEKSFAKYTPNTTILYPTEEEQKLVTQGICNAKNAHRYDSEGSNVNPHHIFTNLVARFKERYKNMERVCIISGCTDINNVFFIEDRDYIDSLETLAEVIYERYEKNY